MEDSGGSMRVEASKFWICTKVMTNHLISLYGVYSIVNHKPASA